MLRLSKNESRLLAEAYLSIYEQAAYPGDKQKLHDEYVKLVQGDYTKFIQWLKQYSDDPNLRPILTAGTQDGLANDEAFKVQTINIPVHDLHATQQEIEVGASLANPCTNKFNCLPLLLGKEPIRLGPPGDDTIITLDGKWVLDGHHRWSQIYCINPDALVVCDNLNNPNIKDYTEVLKAVQIGIAAKKKEVPSKPFPEGGTNLLDPNQFSKSIAIKTILGMVTEDAVKIAEKFGYAKTKEEFAERVANNIEQMQKVNPTKNKPKREVMPQPGKEPEPKMTMKDAIYSSGEIDFKAPFAPNK